MVLGASFMMTDEDARIQRKLIAQYEAANFVREKMGLIREVSSTIRQAREARGEERGSSRTPFRERPPLRRIIPNPELREGRSLSISWNEGTSSLVDHDDDGNNNAERSIRLEEIATSFFPKDFQESPPPAPPPAAVTASSSSLSVDLVVGDDDASSYSPGDHSNMSLEQQQQQQQQPNLSSKRMRWNEKCKGVIVSDNFDPVASNDVVLTSEEHLSLCIGCQAHLCVKRIADFVICPKCETVSPTTSFMHHHPSRIR